jgi:hypothetical protein
MRKYMHHITKLKVEEAEVEDINHQLIHLVSKDILSCMVDNKSESVLKIDKVKNHLET